jgi:hypothetical protein
MFDVRRLAAVVALALIACVPATADAASKRVTVPPPLTSAAAPPGTAFKGDGMWIWYVNQSNRGSISSIANRAKASGIETLFIKAGDGRKAWSQFNKGLVNKLKARGLHVCGWQYVYGRWPATEAKVGAYAKKQGAECFVIDAEAEVEGKYAAASTYTRKLRAGVGQSFPVGLAGFPYVDYHPGYPFSVFLGPGGAQFNVPQMYWRAIGVSVDEIYAHTYLYGGLYGRPIAPLGQTYSSPPSSQITRFRALADAYGAPGVSWWSWQSTSSGGWRSLAREVTPVAAAQAPLPAAPTLKRGAKGDMVVWAQQHLLAAGEKTTVNGIFDTRTVRAVKAFQTANAMTATGLLDTATWWVLLSGEPAPVKWVAGKGAHAAGSGALPEPASARLPALAREIPPKKH